MPSTILVAEDNRDLGRSLALILNEHGWDTVLAHDAREAAQAFLTVRPDVIVLDAGLIPSLPGPLPPQVPVVLISGSPFASPGASSVLQKPFSAERFVNLIRRVLTPLSR